MISRGEARLIENPAVKGFNYYPFDNEAMKRALDQMVTESGVELLLYTKITGAQKEDGKIKGLYLSGCEGDLYVEADIFLDTTGDAAVAMFAGEELAVGDEQGNTQEPTMMSYYAGVDFDRYEAFLKTYEDGKKAAKVNMIHDLVPRAVADGVLSVVDLHHPGIFRINNSDNVGLLNAGHVYGADCVTSSGLTKATVEGRRMAAEMLDFYHKYVPGFENAYLVTTGSSLALRETRRLVGRYVTTFNDKSNYVKFDDAIMRFDGGAVSDVHASSSDAKAYQAYVDLYKDREKVRRDDWAHLPYRSLLAKNTNNLLVAGRCVSADRKVQGQIRLMGYCFMMGEAAGVAASIAWEDQVMLAQIDVKKLQGELKVLGVETI